MEELLKLSDGKYKGKDIQINGGAFSKIYNITNTEKKNNKYIVKISKEKDKYEAINEIEILIRIKKNRHKYKQKMTNNNLYIKSKIITIKDYYFNEDKFYVIYKKYLTTLEEFNILYNKTFNNTLPIPIISKISNSLLYGLYELKLSGIIHSDIKPNNIMIEIIGYNSLNKVFSDIKKNKLSNIKLLELINIKIIDFNKAQFDSSIFKSTSVQTLYYSPPEIILGNRDYNSSIDLWSVCCIMYELTTSLFIFDVFNYNEVNNLNYINYNIESNEFFSKHNMKSSENISDNSRYEYKEELLNNLALLTIYKYKMGDNNFLNGKNVEIYYSNNILLGSCIKSEEKQIELVDLKILYENSNDKQFYNKILNIFNKVFIYDYKNRLTIEEIIKNYIL